MGTRQQVIHNNPGTPHINLLIVLDSPPDLWRHVDWRAAVGGEHLIGQDLANAKVGEFEHTVRLAAGNQQVLGLCYYRFIP